MKLPHPFLFIAGYRVYSTQSENSERVLALCERNNIP